MLEKLQGPTYPESTFESSQFAQCTHQHTNMHDQAVEYIDIFIQNKRKRVQIKISQLIRLMLTL